MKTVPTVLALGFATQALAHGYVYRVTADNTIYPGWDVYIDPRIEPAPARIAFGGGDVGPIFDMNSADIACAKVHSPAPGAIAEVRAGSNITFHWSRWLYSHKGPITAWMAPYEGNISDVDVNQLEFVKFAEDTIDDNGVWGTVKLMDETNGTWTATIPADIKPGNYVIRQEIIALHFAVSTTPGFEWSPIGPQFYLTCFNFKITGNGDATPKGEKFPGAYKVDEPGFHFDVKSNETYPTVGPALYKSSYTVELEPKERVVISPTGQGEEADTAYYNTQYDVLAQQGAMTSYFDSIGG
ncbi:hypothetical protein MFIFM68171_08151 [Madurella fahalii]|uniref:lytic cellulose monooxygenase (C4-dehydrogenating) n=1 Tax=Madurella fahalii TaxID=1157608 RepID=A0ABQ0GJJ9_9PEZI